MTTQGTHICLIPSLILHSGQVEGGHGPMVYNRIMLMPLNAKLHEMQENTHGLVQLIRAAMPDS